MGEKIARRNYGAGSHFVLSNSDSSYLPRCSVPGCYVSLVTLLKGSWNHSSAKTYLQITLRGPGVAACINLLARFESIGASALHTPPLLVLIKVA